MDVTCGVFWFFISVLKWWQKSCNHPVPGENNGYTVIRKKKISADGNRKENKAYAMRWIQLCGVVDC
jgi:hypothetical protein